MITITIVLDSGCELAGVSNQTSAIRERTKVIETFPQTFEIGEILGKVYSPFFNEYISFCKSEIRKMSPR